MIRTLEVKGTEHFVLSYFVDLCTELFSFLKALMYKNLVLHILHKMASSQNESADICVDGH